ncbi:MAG: MFS transporter [Tahibacter sp.]
MNRYTQFIIVWAGQAASTLGSSILSFALGVWVYQQTGSMKSFGLVIFFAMLPYVVLAPVSGVLVDRWPRRTVMLACDLGAGLCAFTLFVFLSWQTLQVWHIYALTFTGMVFQCFHQLAYAASMTTLLPDRAMRARANGMMQLGLAGAFVVGPLVAGVLLTKLQLRGVILLDCASFLIAFGTLVPIRLPELDASQRPPRKVFFREFADGLQHIRSQSGLVSLMLLVAASNFSIGFVQVLFTPMVLTISNQEVLGVLVSVGGAGMVVGGIACSVWGVPAQAIRGVWLGLALDGACLVVGSLRPSIVLWGASVFCYFLAIPLINASLQSIWQQRVPAELQGRVFSVRSMVSFVCLPAAYLISPLLAMHFFEPWLSPDGALASSLGAWFGTGNGRGMALMFLVAGIALLGLAFAAARNRKLMLHRESHDETALPRSSAALSGQAR